MFDRITVDLVHNLEDVPRFMDWLVDRCRRKVRLAIDTETTALHPVTWRRRGFCRLWQVGDTESGWAIPAPEWHRLCHHAMDIIRLSRTRVTMQSARYDLHTCAGEGWPLPDWDVIDDTEIQSKLLRPWATRHGLKPTAVDLLGAWAGTGQDSLRRVFRATGTSWDDIDYTNKVYWAYGVMDTILTNLVWEKMGDPGGWYEIEMEYQRLVYEWEARGLRVDEQHLLTHKQAYGDQLASLEAQLEDLGFHKPRSNKVVEQALRDLGHDPTELTPKGNVALNKEVMARIQQAGGPAARAAHLLVEYRRLASWRQVYFEKMLEATVNGRVHPFIRTMGAKTGRSSITDPPAQTIPKHPLTRGVFVPDPGCELWAVDYDTQELRVFAALANEVPMVETFNQGGKLHDLVAEMAGVDREIAKILNYARLYGAGLSKLAATTGKSEREMAAIINRIDQRFPAAAAFMAETVRRVRDRREAEGYGYAEVPRSWRRIGVEDDKDYTALNYMIQGYGADTLKLAALRLDRAGYSSAVLLPVHDELLLQFPKGEGEEAAREVAKIMTDDNLSVRLTTTAEGPLRRWGDKYQEEPPT